MKPRPLLVHRRRLSAGFACVALALALASSSLFAQTTPNPPERMTYQGFLVDANGVALGNSAPKNYDVIFRIYNHESASATANLLWSEQQTITVDKGYFSVLLGEGAAVGSEDRPALSSLFKGPTASDRFVGITVKGIGAEGSNVDIQPRLKLLTSPYAFLAQQAKKLVQDTGADLISSSGNSVTVSGPVTANSFSGSGGSLTGLDADNISSGTLAAARITSHLTGTRTFAGPVGIDTTSPDHLLSLGSDLDDTKLALWESGSSSYGLGIQSSQFRLHLGSSVDRFSFLNAPKGDEIMTLRGNGRLGIGTKDPAARFHVQGGDYVTGILNSTATSGTWLSLGNSSAGGRWWKLISTGSGNGEGAGKLLIGNSDSHASLGPRITIDQNARLGIGTDSPDTPLTIRGGDPRIRLYNNSGEWADFGRGHNYLWLSLNASLWHGGARSATYDGDSNWDFGSDRRLKKDIVDAEPMLDRALKVQVRRYRWKEENSEARHKLGVIAQEVQPLFPEMVSEVENPQTHEKSLAVGYGDFGMIAIKALQEFKAEHDAELAELRAELSNLARENDELRDRLDNRDAVAAAR